jgi:Na+-translocating ferredoxin:NAD+ oxidoreductase RnfC subunit
MKQNAGAAAVACVKVGQRVKRGQVVGEIPDGALGARHHASISGVVTEVNGSVVIEV